MSDHDDLNKLLAEARYQARRSQKVHQGSCSESPVLDEKFSMALSQWSSNDGKVFIPTGSTVNVLVPGVYEISQAVNIGIYFEKIPVKTEGLVRFPDSNSDKVVAEIQKFWDREEIFKTFHLLYKRGIMLYGPPGGGKSCTIRLVMEDVVNREGVVIKFGHPELFIQGMRKFREIQPMTPAVVIMEDIDSILEMFNESEILNILDGVNQLNKIVYLATTNYPEALGARIINRPSRFDKRFKIGYPTAEARRMYFEHLAHGQDMKKLKVDLKRWVADTEKMSIAHLRELFIAVVVLGDDYTEAIETLRTMKEVVDEKEYDQVGFHSNKS